MGCVWKGLGVWVYGCVYGKGGVGCVWKGLGGVCMERVGWGVYGKGGVCECVERGVTEIEIHMKVRSNQTRPDQTSRPTRPDERGQMR